MYQAKEIYDFLKNYNNNDLKKNTNKKITYVLECARPSWIPGWISNYKYSAQTHADALVYFYEQVLNDKIKMANGKYLDLIDYALDKFNINENYDLKYLCALIIKFYFGYDGCYDCALYIIDISQRNRGMFQDSLPPEYCVK